MPPVKWPRSFSQDILSPEGHSVLQGIYTILKGSPNAQTTFMLIYPLIRYKIDMMCVFPIYEVGEFVIKDQNLLLLQISHDVAPGSWPTNNFRISTMMPSRCVLGACIVIQTETVSCHTNSQDTLSLPVIGRGFCEIPACGLSRQNAHFCAWNILQSAVMKK